MKSDYVPLLRTLRELYEIPRGRARFRRYLDVIWNRGGADGERIPLIAANPMAGKHVTALLDDLLAIDADGIAAHATAEVARQLSDFPAECKVGLVIADDLMGGWTNRYACEFSIRFGAGLPIGPDQPKWSRFPWLTGVLWSSEGASERAVREAILTAAHRAAYAYRHGRAHSLAERLAQEGRVLMASGCTGPMLDDDDIDYTRKVIAPDLEADDLRTTVECLFGDVAARSLGFTPRGLSAGAGLALALRDARVGAGLTA
ncbi:MAG: hypothetical protein U0790_28800 [Isosphaeraceae bacterium]